MVLEGLFVAEALGAFRAGVGALASVRPLVLQQVVLLGKILPTLSTVVRSLPSVDALVFQQVVLPDEAFAALAAGVGALAGVHAVVVGQLGLLAEGLVALAALVGPLARVSPLVPQEVRGPAEGLAALWADEGELALARVHPLMHRQRDLQPKALAALAAGVRPLAHVGDLVLAQAGLVAEAALALAAFVGFPRRRRRPGLRLEAALVSEGLSAAGWGSHPSPRSVQPLVQQELLLEAEAEVAGVALVWALLEVVALVDDVVDAQHEALAALRANVRPLPRPVPLLEGHRTGLHTGVSLTKWGADPHCGSGGLCNPLVLPHHFHVAI